MTFLEVLSHLQSRNIKLWSAEGRLRYSGPAEEITSKLLGELSKYKKELLAFLADAEMSTRTVQPPVTSSMSRQSRVHASFAQWRMWFVNRLSETSSAYNIERIVTLTGPLNISALERSINEIVRRHDSLRATFSLIGDELFQIISPFSAFRLPIKDLRSIPNMADRGAKAEKLVADEIEQLFDLAEGPLFRVKLFGLSDEDHILVVTFHHIVADGWSLGVFFRELSALYEAFSQGNDSPLKDLSIQYGDYVRWQREWLQGDVLEQRLFYWKNQLNNVPKLLNLPTDHPRPTQQSFGGASLSMILSKELSDKLNALSRQEGVTLFMILLAAFQALLYRLSGQDDIVVGSPIAGRNRSEFEGLIGLFLNTLVLHTDLSGNPSFRELLKRVRKVTLGAYAHQDVPFERLLQEMRLERSLSYTPLFQAMFVLLNTPDSELKLSGLTTSWLDNRFKLQRTTSMFDLFLWIYESPDGLYGKVSYNTDLFEAITIQRTIDHFRILLESIVGEPDQSITVFPLLRVEEREQILVEWNNTQTGYPQDRFVHQLFEEQVERTPDAVAVVLERQQLTYRELNTRSNQLAHYLKNRGVGIETPVGICLERPLEMVVGLLGILKAGGVYVPLDPAYPKERLAFMVEDTQMQVLLTQKELINDLSEIIRSEESLSRVEHRNSKFQGPAVVCVDTDWQDIGMESAQTPVSEATAENLAYVIYTSGSTGKPKGVMISHRGIANRVLWGLSTYQLTRTDRVLQSFSYTFDFSIWEIFTALVAGATLVMARPGERQDSGYLAKLIADEKVTVAGFVPSMLDVLLEEKDFQSCSCLKKVVCGGEAFPVEIQERFFTHFYAELQNTYGPTEAAIDVTFWICKPEKMQRTVPIGHPIANTQIYILDSHLQPVPIGIRGELYIGGVGLARGYLSSPDLTAEKFIPNPFTDQAGARLYKTGDLARYLPDGNIEFLGRIDHQVKIRGYRIELGEIESVLNQHAAVRDSVVVAANDTTANHDVADNLESDKRLVAYVAQTRKQTVTISELRIFLKDKLPDYMVPSAFVFLDSLPLTPNGKLDRKALPAPDQNRPELEDTFVAPRSPVEELLAQIWATVFKVNQVGVDDNFFDLGGHSLLAARVVSRVRDALQIDLPLRTLFEKPTIAELTEAIAHGPIGPDELERTAQLFLKLSTFSTDEVEQLLSEKQSLLRESVH